MIPPASNHGRRQYPQAPPVAVAPDDIGGLIAQLCRRRVRLRPADRLGPRPGQAGRLRSREHKIVWSRTCLGDPTPGIGVLEVLRIDRHARRLRGKFDSLDAENAARTVMGDRTTVIDHPRDECHQRA